MPERYKRPTAFVLGYHGCSREIGESVLAGDLQLKKSENTYDWLGPGVYFWEGSPHRAMQFAVDVAERMPHLSRGRIAEPFVIGAVIDLRRCLSLFDADALDEMKRGYETLTRVLGRVVPRLRNLIQGTCSEGHVQIAVPNLDCIMGYFRPIGARRIRDPWSPPI